MASGEPLASVVLLSHARPLLIGPALASVVGQTARDREILVVDNRSAASGDIAAIVAGFPEARLIASPRNLGFTGGMNLGLAHAKGRYVLFTEDDIVLPPECLEALIAYAERHPGTGLATGLVVEVTDGTILYAGGEVSLGPVWDMRIAGRGESDRGQYTQAVQVGYATGCTMLAPRALLSRIGGFRDDFFLYYEDVDLSLRVLAAGYAITCLPNVRLMHRASVSTGDVGLVDYHKLKNLRALYVLHAPARVLPEFFLRYGLLEPVRELFRDPARCVRMVRACWWVLVHLPSLLAGRRQIALLRYQALAARAL